MVSHSYNGVGPTEIGAPESRRIGLTSCVASVSALAKSCHQSATYATGRGVESEIVALRGNYVSRPHFLRG